MREQRMTDLEIATQLRVTPKEVFRARRKHGLLTDEEREQIRQGRRKLATGGIVAGLALGVIGAGGIFYLLTRPPTYEEAIKDETKRDYWIKHTFSKLPPYVKVKYADERLADEVSKARGQVIRIPGVTFAITLKDNQQFAPGNKNTSTIYFLQECFPQEALQMSNYRHDLELVIRNTGYRHERVHAEHIYGGIPRYPTERFFRNNGQFNNLLFIAVTEILASPEEYAGLKESRHKARSDFYGIYMKTAPKANAIAYYSLLSDKMVTDSMDPTFITQLKKDLNPDNLKFS